MIAVGSPSNDTSVRHGEGIPNIPPLELSVVAGARNEDGSTYHFRTTYDKVVLLAEDEFPVDGELQAHPSALGDPFQPGSNLWQCVFNETLLEGYIYVTRVTGTAPDTAKTKTAGLSDFPYSMRLFEEWARWQDALLSEGDYGIGRHPGSALRRDSVAPGRLSG